MFDCSKHVECDFLAVKKFQTIILFDCCKHTKLWLQKKLGVVECERALQIIILDYLNHVVLKFANYHVNNIL